ncbi:MAG: Crp/Fnr family transcriptional regulator, partial [Massilia sp.]|nr:Crp/Fnr family transcriptional regulator [Massilia sp.]
EYGSKLENVYFPTTAIVSLLYVMEDGATTEIAVIGHEGVVGMSLFMGERAMCSAVVQSAGYGYRLKTHFLRDAFNQGGALPQLLMRYTNALFAQMAQNAVGGRHSSIEQKLCRWLLDRLDRSPSNELKVTQELISIMLGVRRESITAAAGKLQDDGLIQYRRGNITVIDRQGLEAYAGECYKVAKTEYDRLLADVAR